MGTDVQQQIANHTESPPELPRLFSTISAEPDERRRQREDRDAQRAAEVAAADRFRCRRALRLIAGGRYVDCTLDSFTIALPEQRRVIDSVREYASDLQGRIDRCEGMILFG